MASPTEIRKGRVMNFQNAPHLVLDMQHRTQGRQAGFVQVTMRNLNNGTSTNAKFRSTDSVDFCHTSNNKLEYSYIDDQGYHFMDTDTFEDHVLPAEVCDSSKLYLVENKPYEILMVDDVPVAINLPAAVEMEITESAEGVKGDTASNVQKPATMQTGLVVQVPLFIKPGEIIKVRTEDGSYLGRA
ncbi:elongation factor P [Cerasicoccus arenae]|uniref:Elongation factor P n=1 Tax=Cerasicoccus arenae TaxID=424488 RepID=A0A8J3GBK1_9BACT|nr:elongation factor P [Cerasicoccus arenae]MBK1857678.1 elongation factor P [Cerasicoccus arenae]GHB91429.1 elongation factor P [Cerasicoccus arenae]